MCLDNADVVIDGLESIAPPALPGGHTGNSGLTISSSASNTVVSATGLVAFSAKDTATFHTHSSRSSCSAAHIIHHPLLSPARLIPLQAPF